MRYKKMTRSAEKALKRDVTSTYPDKRIRFAENDIERQRKIAMRASWLDCRNPAAVRAKSDALRRYNRALRAHLIRVHLRAPDELTDDWGLDAMHEEIHGRS